MKAPETVYLSPHLDDAALSCGGQIADRTTRGEPVAVVTLFTADEPPEGISAFAARLHRLWNLDSGVVAARRREDQAACAVLGARAEHWGEMEGLYRRGPGGDLLYPDRAALFGPLHAADRELEERLAGRLAELSAALPAGSRIVCPLGAGAHVDHLLVRRAAERALAGEAEAERLFYYEDDPYAALDRRAVAAAQGDDAWVPEPVRLSAGGLDAKIEAIAAYASQLRPLFGGRWRMARQVRRMARRRGGERLWRRARPGAGAAPGGGSG